jgi:two-component system chemotaxis response regulator CheB
MPVMDGSTALKHIMIKNPCPVVIISSLGSRSGMNVLDFLRLGAVDFISKPTKTEDISHHQQEIIERVRQAGKARIDNFRRVKTLRVLHEEKDKSGDQLPCKQLVVVNSGVGGHAELIKMVPLFPREVNACLILLQTMPSEFVAPLANYLNKRSRSLVLPLQTEVPLSAGRCYIGTNNFSLKLTLKDEKYNLWLEDTISKSGQLYNCFDFFLHSIADSFCDRVMVVLLSGADVGDLDGLRRIRKRNGRIITQKTTSCMVPYPLEKAIEADLVEMEANLDEIAKTILLTAHI